MRCYQYRRTEVLKILAEEEQHIVLTCGNATQSKKRWLRHDKIPFEKAGVHKDIGTPLLHIVIEIKENRVVVPSIEIV